MLASFDWNAIGATAGVVAVVLTVVLVGVPAIARVTRKRRDAGKVAEVALAARVDQLEKDRTLMFDWLLGPVGFDGVRRGGFMETDKVFKKDVLGRLPK